MNEKKKNYWYVQKTTNINNETVYFTMYSTQIKNMIKEYEQF